jgi:non-ribosomal peptide synthetase component E (peptide arylation enzyme)
VSITVFKFSTVSNLTLKRLRVTNDLACALAQSTIRELTKSLVQAPNQRVFFDDVYISFVALFRMTNFNVGIINSIIILTSEMCATVLFEKLSFLT